jgi:thioredoxin-like negative regulator of GroEL
VKKIDVISEKTIRAMIKNLSVKCYNDGLERAKNRELTNAAELLKKSVLYDGKNTNARNLLGLVLYEKGRYGEAITQWRLSLKISPKDNTAEVYLKNLLSDRRFLKRLEIPKIYNEALELLKNGNEDLAAIRLKRIMELDKKCVDAYCLYILLLIKQDRRAEAYSLVKRVFRLDAENPTAARYISQVRSAKKDVRKPRRASIAISENIVIAPLAFALGVLCCVVVYFTLALPYLKEQNNIALAEVNEKYNKSVEEYNTMVEKNAASLEKLTEENENLKSKLYTSNEQQLQQKVSELSAIQDEFDEGNEQDAAQALLKVDTNGFSDELKERYERMKKDILPTAAQKYYEDGKSQMNKGNTKRATENFEKCVECTQEGDEVRYSAMYQLGKMSDEAGDTEKAKAYFKEVAENHPVKAIKNEAQSYIDENE